jgi:hypothetical protein
LEKCAKNFLESGRVHRKQCMGKAMENEIKELDSMKAYKYLGLEESHNIENKSEKERLKRGYIRRLSLILIKELS